jgi:hypothetical protein
MLSERWLLIFREHTAAIFTVEDGGSMFLRLVDNQPREYTCQLRITQTEYSHMVLRVGLKVSDNILSGIIFVR